MITLWMRFRHRLIRWLAGRDMVMINVFITAETIKIGAAAGRTTLYHHNAVNGSRIPDYSGRNDGAAAITIYAEATVTE